jgi:hypothetical protein
LQDNEPLMRALSNLISLNQPELVLFVGEALVGNDAVDQLVKFNRSLADLAPGAAAGEQRSPTCVTALHLSLCMALHASVRCLHMPKSAFRRNPCISKLRTCNAWLDQEGPAQTSWCSEWAVHVSKPSSM